MDLSHMDLSHMDLYINREAVVEEIADIAYVVADVARSGENDHRLHQTFDICEEGNINRVNTLLDHAFAEVCAILPVIPKAASAEAGKNCASAALGKRCAPPSGGNREPGFRIAGRRLATIPANRLPLVRETVKEYLISRVLQGWLSVTLPECAPQWGERGEELLKKLSHIATGSRTGTRRSTPF